MSHLGVRFSGRIFKSGMFFFCEGMSWWISLPDSNHCFQWISGNLSKYFYSTGTGSVKPDLDHCYHLKTTEMNCSTTRLTSHSWAELLRRKITSLLKGVWHSSGQLSQSVFSPTLYRVYFSPLSLNPLFRHCMWSILWKSCTPLSRLLNH